MRLHVAGGIFAEVDSDTYEWAKNHKWCLTAGYPSSRMGGNKLTYLHRLIMDAPRGKVVDHINGNKLDNRRSNLRVCTHRANIFNRPKLNKNNKSGYRGVCWSRTMNKWQARVKVNYKNITLGYFDDVKEAAGVVSTYRNDLSEVLK